MEKCNRCGAESLYFYNFIYHRSDSSIENNFMLCPTCLIELKEFLDIKKFHSDTTQYGHLSFEIPCDYKIIKGDGD